MIVKTQEHTTKEKSIVVYYQLCLSSNETYTWATKVNASWPCSQLKGHRLRVTVDQNGILDYAIDGQYKDIDDNELTACVADHLPDNCKHLWPCWKM